MQVIPPTLGGSSEPLLFWLLLDESDAEICCCSAQSVSPRVCVCVFRILNSKGWGLIMKPDSSSPASICLTVPPIFPSIPSLPVFFFFFLSVSNLPLFLPGSDPPPCSLPGPRLSCSFSFSLSLSLRAPGLSGSCQVSRRARWCHPRRHRWGPPGWLVSSVLPRGDTLRCESCRTAVTAGPARRRNTHTHSARNLQTLQYMDFLRTCP